MVILSALDANDRIQIYVTLSGVPTTTIVVLAGESVGADGVLPLSSLALILVKRGGRESGRGRGCSRQASTQRSQGQTDRAHTYAAWVGRERRHPPRGNGTKKRKCSCQRVLM